MTPVAAAIAAHFGIQAKQAQIVAALLAANGEYVGSHTLARSCGIASDGALKVHIHYLREAGVDVGCEKGVGYFLGREARAICRAALRRQARMLAAAGEGAGRAAG